MPQVFVGIGSNIDRANHIRTAVKELRKVNERVVLSSIYESPAIGFDGDNFYNLIATYESDAPLQEILDELFELERRHGRVRGINRFAPRTLDLDLLLYGDLVRHDEQVQIPRPEITQYAFVLKPLSEIAPALRHPVSGLTFHELWGQSGIKNQNIWPVKLEIF